ncbi:hypothetical protein LGK95_15180 [Clostridium algoriphilum]|uniref:hypothetical protein n=1 Tax=Clostridium algoriphilum TaxID=198347 RepID=UPI001CF1B753|nr:hypothetical protein [Clostridium algoriphilum]MCB2294842.1 hypothetical protein [Clostridium algoriphilum]
MFEEEIGFEELQLYEGQVPETSIGAIAAPIYQTAYYVFKNSDYSSTLREYLFKHSK